MLAVYAPDVPLREPFDPSRVRAASRPADAPWTVSELAEQIDLALRAGLPARVRVVGEVSGLRQRTHWYFDLKDEAAIVGCVMFVSHAGAGARYLRNGAQVVVSGRVEHYAPQGRTSLIVTAVEPVGEGPLERAFRALCAELAALGWFDPARKRPLPALPRRIAVITSRDGAALADVLDTLRRRSPWISVVLLDVRVQGEQAADQIARAIRWIGRHHLELGVDAVLLTRGGGSPEDLWAFNERVVAQAIVTCPVPIVAAIGHETDTTIAELVADERAATPTQAAMRIAPDAEALREQLAQMSRRLATVARRRIDWEQHRLRAAARHPLLSDPGAWLQRARRQLDHAAARLHASVALRVGGGARRLESLAARLEPHRPVALLARRAARFERVRHDLAGRWADLHARLIMRVDAADRTLRAVGPLNVLRRGYSCTFDARGRPIRSVGQVGPGERIRTLVGDGAIRSRVVDTEPALPQRRDGRVHLAPRPALPPQEPMDLFGTR